MSIFNGTDEVDDIFGGTADADVVNGKDGADTLSGADLSDSIMGGAGNDQIHGGLGADVLDGDGFQSKTNFYAGSDVIFGDAGDDLIYGGEGDDTLNGGANNDKLYGDSSYFTDASGSVQPQGPNLAQPDAGNDFMVGGDGDDTVSSLLGADTMKGGDGIDVLVFERRDLNDANNYVINIAATGNQTLAGGSIISGFEVLHAAGSGGSDSFTGGAYDDVLNGGDGANTLTGGGGSDSLFAGSGDDHLDGGEGADLVSGDAYPNSVSFFGPGTVVATSGDDVMDGGAGNDTVVSYVGQDTLDGGADTDLVVLDRTASATAFTIDMSTAGVQTLADGTTIVDFEQLQARGGGGADLFQGGELADSLSGGAGNDTLAGRGGDDSLNGGAGFDMATFTNATGGVHVDLSIGGPQATGAAGTETLRFIEGITGSGAADQLTGGSGDDLLSGGGGADVLVGDGSAAPVAAIVASDATGAPRPGSVSTGGFSPDGRFVTFTSDAADLIAGDSPTSPQVYVKDLVTGEVQLVSADASGLEQGGDEYGRPVFVGSDQKVLFESTDDFAGAAGGDDRLYLKNLATGQLTLFSTNGAGEAADGDTYSPSVTADGAKVLFLSEADNLASGDADVDTDAFIKDVATGAVTLVPTDDPHDATAYLDFARISADGSKVLYADSEGEGGPDPGVVNLYSRDLATGVVTEVSHNEAGASNLSGVYTADMSADGSKVVFSTTDTLLPSDTDGGSYDVYLRDVPTGVLTLISAVGSPDSDGASNIAPAISGDGSKVAFASYGSEFGSAGGIFIKDLGTGAITALTDQYGEPVVSESVNAISFSPDGTRLLVEMVPGSEIAGGTDTSSVSIFAFDLAPQGADTLLGGAGADTLAGGVGDDLLDGGQDTDTVSYAAATAGVSVSLASTAAQATGGAGADTLLNIENLLGSAFNDHLAGSSADNLIRGGAGKDVLEGGLGTDTLDGGLGRNTLSYEHAGAAVKVDLSVAAAQDTGGAGVDLVSHFDNLTGSAFNDLLTGDSEKNNINGGDGRDQLNGGDGADKLQGGAGNDTLVGGLGRDQLNGGAGADTYRFDGLEVNSDFIRGLAGVDVIDLHLLDADTTAGHVGDQAFTLVTGFHHHAGEARLNYQAGKDITLLQLDTDGDGQANMTITIDGQHTDFANFVL